MSAFRTLASPRVRLTVVGVAAVLALIFFAYLAAVESPEENLKDLPVALVNEEAAWVLGFYLVGSAVLGYAISLIRDFLARRKKLGVRRLGEPAATDR